MNTPNSNQVANKPVTLDSVNALITQLNTLPLDSPLREEVLRQFHESIAILTRPSPEEEELKELHRRQHERSHFLKDYCHSKVEELKNQWEGYDHISKAPKPHSVLRFNEMVRIIYIEPVNSRSYSYSSSSSLSIPSCANRRNDEEERPVSSSSSSSSLSITSCLKRRKDEEDDKAEDDATDKDSSSPSTKRSAP
jgi:hypothetical protein